MQWPPLNLNYFFEPPEIWQFKTERAVSILSFGLQALHFGFFESQECYPYLTEGSTLLKHFHSASLHSIHCSQLWLFYQVICPFAQSFYLGKRQSGWAFLFAAIGGPNARTETWARLSCTLVGLSAQLPSYAAWDLEQARFSSEPFSPASQERCLLIALFVSDT